MEARLLTEGVEGWHDQQHQLSDVPNPMLHGILFAFPYTSVPQGTRISMFFGGVDEYFDVYVLLRQDGTNTGGCDQALPNEGWDKLPWIMRYDEGGVTKVPAMPAPANQ